MTKPFRPSCRAASLMLASVVAVLALAACAHETSARQGGGEASAGSAVEVTIQTFAFEPARVEVASGTSVTWTNRDAILHTVTSGIAEKQGVPGVSKDKRASPSGLFDHEVDGEGATFSFTFEEAGAFEYFCAIHPGMKGAVVVR